MKWIAFIALLACAAPTTAQERRATAVFVAGALADDITTWRNMRAGHTEDDPLYFYARAQPKGVLISQIAVDVVTLWLAHHYAPRHPKLARVALYSLGAMRGGTAIYNIHWDLQH